MAAAGEDVYCTLLMSDSYLPGAAVLAHSLRDSGTTKKLAVLITPDSLLSSTITELKSLYDYVIPVEKIANYNLENLNRLGRLDLRFALTKIALWRQHQFRKICYLDADMVALRAPDELFNLQSSFAAAPDIGWPDCFNSGMMVLTPDISEYWSLHTLALSGTSFDGADQGLLNEHFGGGRPWERLSFTYNCTPSSGYQYEPAYRHFRSSIKMVHFIGKDKPWQQGRNALDAAGSGVYKELLGRWWSVYDRHYRIQQSSALGSIQPTTAAVQSYVKDERSQAAFEWAATGLSRPALSQPLPSSSEQHQSTSTIAFAAIPSEPPEASAVTTERPFTESSEEWADNINQDEFSVQSPPPPPPPPEPTPVARALSPPQNQWDATRFEPPANTKPEAKNFPSTRYEMSSDPGLFQAPSSYPDVPKNFYYQPPPKPAQEENVATLFPWETNAAKPTRVFADDIKASQVSPETPSDGPTSSPQPRPPPLGSVPTAVRHFGHQFPTVPPKDFSSSDLWDSFSRTNAWDEVSSIEQYVRALKEAHSRKAPVQVINDDSGREKATETKDFATGSTGVITPSKRRESLILTDFPTEIERPSLPVTPAPIRRPTFWGGQDVPGARETEDLPAAQGVPDQEDWNPIEKLEQLRRSSIATATEETPLSPPKPLPMRPIPESSINLGTPSTSGSEPTPFDSSISPRSSSTTTATIPADQPRVLLEGFDISGSAAQPSQKGNMGRAV